MALGSGVSASDLFGSDAALVVAFGAAFVSSSNDELSSEILWDLNFGATLVVVLGWTFGSGFSSSEEELSSELFSDLE